jgi:hypothetical protein
MCAGSFFVSRGATISSARAARHPGHGVLYSAHYAAVPHQASPPSPPAASPGSVLLCSTSSRRQQQVLEKVSIHLKRKGRRVQTLPAERMVGLTHSRNPAGSSGQG